MYSAYSVYVRHCLQVLQDLSVYESKAQRSYNPRPLPPRPPQPPQPRPLPLPAPAPPREGGAPPGIVGAPALRSRRKRSARAIGPFFCWWPFFSGGTDTYEVFEVNIS